MRRVVDEERCQTKMERLYKEYVFHYDCLPNATSSSFLNQFQIEQAYAGKEASISDIGFSYFSKFLNICNINIYFWMISMTYNYIQR